MRCKLLVLFIGALLSSPAPLLSAEDGVRDSVVRISVTQRAPNLWQPWTKNQPSESSGSGFVIEGRRILTNAHVVSYASQVYVQPNQSAEKLPAKIAFYAPAIDLAVLTLDDESFFEGRKAIPWSKTLPPVRSTVNVYGYPLGGEQMSVTEGIVSRVEYAQYYELRTLGLRLQIDAALNPGNSGGPAVSNGQLIGVAFSSMSSAENVGYLIPVEEIEVFLEDVADGKYDGKPSIFDWTQTVENEALRAKLGLSKGVGGVMITSLEQNSDSYPLRVEDVIVAVGDHKIDGDGQTQVTTDLRLPFLYWVPKLTRKGKVPLTIVRSGKEIKLSVPVKTEAALVMPHLKGRYPSYFIYGPLVFSEATIETASMLTDKWRKHLSAHGSPLPPRMTDPPAFPGERLVYVPAQMFSHPLTKGYASPMLCVVSHVDGISVRNLVHLVELFRDGKGEYVEIRFAGRGNETMVFRRKELESATDDVLTDNGIRKQYSDDLEKTWLSDK